ncbi:Na+/H+ antiporter subunit A [Kocuria palustris]|uniref:Na+/H+ antiporter subunit A n=1 Tax=Kocuria palustris TaxID=71999 RepID=UPI0011A40856|nr:Na+/H+ antiporter subunit A [Kocuria palustris]
MLAVLIAHAVIALLAAPLFQRLGRSAFYLIAAVPAASFVWVLLQGGRAASGQWVQDIPWLPTLDLSIALRTDSLAWVMSLIVLGIGALVLAYCARYFSDDSPDIGTFGAQLVAFAGAMYGLVVADDLLLLFVFWEITTVLSFLLIGYARTRLSARRASMQALVITTAGGLTMLVGVILLGQTAGTYRISELVAMGPQLAVDGPIVDVAIALLLVGAVTKSALIPFHFWLPEAMAAPTPVSAYLHAASMVKAGIYLVARLAPGFSETAAWQPMLVTLGVGTMVFGGWVAMRQYDLKLLLAYGTVSQLGFMVIVLSADTPDAALAGMALLVGHALFKATLFLTVGIIDHETGTRDIRKLSGLGKQMPVLLVVAIIAAASMAGIPPFGGFVAKEAVLGALVDGVGAQGGDPVAWIRLLGVILGSVFTVVYSARFVWGAFGVKRSAFAQLPTGEDGRPMRTPAHRAAPSFTAPAVVLTVLTVVYGFVPGPVESALMPWVGEFDGEATLHLALWHGVTPALLISLGIIAVGLILHANRRVLAQLLHGLPHMPPAERIYREVIDALDRLAVWVTGKTQRGSLTFYLSVIFVTAIVVPVTVLFLHETPPLGSMRIADSWGQLVAAALIIGAALAVLRAGKRFLAVLLVSVTGYGLALTFALQGAPDLALTQTLVETIALVAFVLALRTLPAPVWDRRADRSRLPRAIIAVAFGVFMMLLTAFSMASRTESPISFALPQMAYEGGDGENVVNTLLVDIRVWDTFGEISVLVLAATGIASLIFVQGRRDRPRAVSPSTGQIRQIRRRAEVTARVHETEYDRASRGFRGGFDDPYIVAGRTLSPERRSIVLEIVTRLLFHTIIMFSLYFLIAGHNLPGGGFAGGLTAGLALTLRYIAGGRYELWRSTPVNAGTMLGLGLLIGAVYAIAPVFFGGSIMQSYTFEGDWPIIGHVKFVTAVIFDVGVYLVVVGTILDVLRSLGGQIDQHSEDDALRRRRRAAGRGGSRIRVVRRPSSEPGSTGAITVLREEASDDVDLTESDATRDVTVSRTDLKDIGDQDDASGGGLRREQILNTGRGASRTDHEAEEGRR